MDTATETEGNTGGPERNRVRCTRAPLGPGEKATAYLHVHAGMEAEVGTTSRVRIRSGEAQAKAEAPAGVAAEGLPARFATDGRVRTAETGNALLSCDESQPGCRRALDRRAPARLLDNNAWVMRRVDRDDDPSTRSSSAARLRLPPGAKVRWAGLYWSGTTDVNGMAVGEMAARLRAPGGSRYRTLRADEITRARLPGATAYRAFADVTSLVRRSGGGVWWGADVPSSTGAAAYAGWSLVTVVEDPRAPHRRAMVLDGMRLAGYQLAEKLEIPLGGLLAGSRPARVGLVAWEGDAGLRGDRLLLDGRPLAPHGGTSSRATSGNVLDSSSGGAIGPSLAFGTDIDEFTARLGAGHGLALATEQDAVLTGVVTVTAPGL